MKRWMVFDIGCIECGESSAVVGVFKTKEEALAANEGQESRTEFRGGQHNVEVFEIAVPE